jgi:hypothetical protein
MPDGGQAFVFLKSQGATSFTELSNYFPNDFLNLWRQISETIAQQPQALWSKAQTDDGFSRIRAARSAALATVGQSPSQDKANSKPTEPQ